MELNDTWFGLEGTDNDHPFLIRGRENLQAFQQSGFYTERIDIVWEYQSNDDSLMPEHADVLLMEQVENALVEHLENDFQSILAFVFTGNNQRVWYWYTKNVQQAGSRINHVLMHFKQLPIQILSEPDPDWQTYHDILD